jgi:hypothetical protein
VNGRNVVKIPLTTKPSSLEVGSESPRLLAVRKLGGPRANGSAPGRKSSLNPTHPSSGSNPVQQQLQQNLHRQLSMKSIKAQRQAAVAINAADAAPSETASAAARAEQAAAAAAQAYQAQVDTTARATAELERQTAELERQQVVLASSASVSAYIKGVRNRVSLTSKRVSNAASSLLGQGADKLRALQSSSAGGASERQESRKKQEAATPVSAQDSPDAVTDKFVINPNSKRMRKWDLVMMLLLFFCALVTPFEVAFMETSLNPLFMVNRFVDVCFVADIVINFFTAFWDNKAGMWIVSHRRIANRYVNSWFFIDLLSIAPFDTISVASGGASGGDKGGAHLKVCRRCALCPGMRPAFVAAGYRPGACARILRGSGTRGHSRACAIANHPTRLPTFRGPSSVVRCPLAAAVVLSPSPSARSCSG